MGGVDTHKDLHVAAARLPQGSRSNAYVPPDYARIHQEPRRKGVTLTLLWQEYVEPRRQDLPPYAIL